MILVIAEQREGTLNRASWEAIAAAQAAGGPVKVAVAGSATSQIRVLAIANDRGMQASRGKPADNGKASKR